MTQVLFVHGMGRSPWSGWPMLRRLRRAGLATSSFSYWVSLEKFDTIRSRLERTIAGMAAHGPLVLVGHSLGGVLIRAALQQLPATPIARVFLLASPQSASRMAQRFSGHWLYRVGTGECGQLLASAAGMAAIAPLACAATSVVGIKPIALNRVFGDEPNDGVLACREVRAPWLGDEVELDVIHTVLPAHRAVASLMLERLGIRAPVSGTSG